MKKFFSKFLKDTRGVVMMEYIVLGCFAVAITLVSVLALGKVYNNGLATMSFATLGASSAAVAQNAQAGEFFGIDLNKAQAYGDNLAQGQETAQSNIINYNVY